MKTEHYHDDETHIRALLEESGLSPRGGMELAAATVRGLILTCRLYTSVAMSTALVESSRIRIFGALRMARARRRRWRWPPERLAAFCSSSVSYPSGKRSMYSSAQAMAQAA